MLPPDRSPAASPSRKVLIVDDEPHLRTLVAHTLEDLEDEGIELIVAADGEEALGLIESEHPVLVILDVMMPRLNGLEVCRQIRERELDVIVVLLTAKGQDLDRVRGEAIAADHYATKPFDPDELLATTRRLLQLPDR